MAWSLLCGPTMARTTLVVTFLLLLASCPDEPLAVPAAGPTEGEGETGAGEGEVAGEGEGEGEVDGEGEAGEGEAGDGDVAGEGEGEGEVEGEGEGEGQADGEGEGEGEFDVEMRCARPGAEPGGSCSVGLGVCSVSGVVSCAGPDTMVCSAVGAEPSTDQDTTADGLDDDCDGVIDEDTCLVDPQRFASCSAGVGACLVVGMLQCVDNQLECDAVAGLAVSTTDDTHDDVDDDCDGLTDEDVVPCMEHPQRGYTCSAGVGVCRQEGTYQCTPDGTTVACSAVAELPITTVDDDLDGRDDDCDGHADEDALHPDRTPCDPALTCCFANVFDVPREIFFHVDVPPDPPPNWHPDCRDPRNQLHWVNNPPASGPHLGCTWGSWGQIYDETGPLLRAYQVHNIEHGGVVFLWNDSASDEARLELFAAFGSLSIGVRCGHTHAVATYDNELPVPVALVAVDRVLLPDATGIIPRAAAIEFTEACRDHGPEITCFRGPDPLVPQPDPNAPPE